MHTQKYTHLMLDNLEVPENATTEPLVIRLTSGSTLPDIFSDGKQL